MIGRRPHFIIYIWVCLLLGLFLAYPTQSAQSAHFDSLKPAAKGQTVYFNAWGGDAKINSYISWAGEILKQRYDITLVHVKLTDTASAVSRILAEKTAGRNRDGTIDLLWVNGENFAAMKRADLLQSQPWVTHLPNWQLTDPVALPAILSDFAEPTDGKESPWGRAQLVFAYDSARLPTPPRSAVMNIGAYAIGQFAAGNSGRGICRVKCHGDVNFAIAKQLA